MSENTGGIRGAKPATPATTVPAPDERLDAAEDQIEWSSEESFPASDPPGWAGSAGVSRELAGREAPPAGPQAGWHVEHETGEQEPQGNGGSR